MAETPKIRVSLVLSESPRQVQQHEFEVSAGTTLETFLASHPVLQSLPAPLNELSQWSVGVWGRKQPMNTVLQDSDRVELYRPLRVDPKVARRERFHKQGPRREVWILMDCWFWKAV
jgi:uncharacterized protein